LKEFLFGLRKQEESIIEKFISSMFEKVGIFELKNGI
jgi:hypothetical protein